MSRKSSKEPKETSARKRSAVPPAASVKKQAEPPTVVPSHAKAAATPPAATEAKALGETPAVQVLPQAAAPEAVAPAAVAPVAALPTASSAPAAQPASPAQPRRDETAALAAALRDGDADVARDAAESLGLLGDPSAVAPLIEVLENADGYYHSVVRAAAAAGLARLGDARAVGPLLKAIDDPMAEASAEAVRALTTLGDGRAVGPLIDVVRNPDGFYLPTVRRAAVLALAKLGGEEAVAELRAVAADAWEDAVIRSEAEQATQGAAPAAHATPPVI